MVSKPAFACAVNKPTRPAGKVQHPGKSLHQTCVPWWKDTAPQEMQSLLLDHLLLLLHSDWKEF